MPLPLLVTFVAVASGTWRIDRLATVIGDGLPAAERLAVLEGSEAPTPTEAGWVLRGVTSNTRYRRGRQGPERPRLCAGRPLGALPADRVGPLGDHRLPDASGRPHRGRGQQRRRLGRCDASHGQPQHGVYRGPRLARQGGAGRTGGGALPAGPRPSHRHLPATRRPDGEFYFGYRPGRGGVFAGPR